MTSLTPQRILLLVHGGDVPWGSRQDSYGGYVRYFKSAITELVNEGLEVTFGSVRARTPIHPVIEGLGCETFALDCRSSRDYPRASLRLASIVRRLRPDVLHLNEASQAAVGGIAGWLARGPVRVFHRHHTYATGSWAAFSRVGSRVTDLTMAVSRSSARAAHEQDRVPVERIRVAYNGVEDLRRPDVDPERIRTALDIPPGDRVIVNVAHMRPEKGQMDLLESLHAVGTQVDLPLHLVFVGGGPEETALKERARSLSEVSVHFAGHQDDVAPWYALADVVVVTSHSEPFGLPAIEGMAACRPIVATAVEGPAEIVVDGGTGLLVPPRDPVQLSRALVSILRDRPGAERMALAGRRRYEEKFTLGAMVSVWIDCYAAAFALGRR